MLRKKSPRHTTSTVKIRRGRSGRFSKKGKPESYQVRRKGGQISQAVKRSGYRTITKKVSARRLEDYHGHIGLAFETTNITTKIGKSRRVELSVEGRSLRRKHLRFKVSLDTSAIKHKESIFNVALHRLLDSLAMRGYRTQYDLNQVDWTKARKFKKRKKVKSPGKWIEVRTKVGRKIKSKWLSVRLRRGKEVIKVGPRFYPLTKGKIKYRGKILKKKNKYTIRMTMQSRTKKFSSKLSPLEKVSITAKIFK